MNYKRKYIKKSKDYQFVFKEQRRRPNLRNCRVSFQPQKISKNRYGKSIIPTFNNDKLYYTPVFYLPQEAIDKEDCLIEFQEKIHDALFKDSQLHFPRPKRSKIFCNVCQCQLSDYMKHIRSESHIRQIQQCSYSQKIQQLCRQFQEGAFNKYNIKQSQEISVSNKSTQSHQFKSSKNKSSMKQEMH